MIEHLKWDSNFFGFPTGTIRSVETPSILKETLEKFRVQGYKLVYFFSDPGNVAVNQEALRNNGILADIKVSYGMVLNNNNTEPGCENIYLYDNDEPGETLYELALQSGEYSRFWTDKNFPSGTYEKLYKLWMLRSVKRILADEVFCYQKEGLIKGMITVYQKSDTGVIGLLGVDVSCRGEKIGSKLISHTKNFYLKKGITKIEVVTQKANKNACAFYEKSGFSIIKTENVYHFWL